MSRWFMNTIEVALDASVLNPFSIGPTTFPNVLVYSFKFKAKLVPLARMFHSGSSSRAIAISSSMATTANSLINGLSTSLTLRADPGRFPMLPYASLLLDAIPSRSSWNRRSRKGIVHYRLACTLGHHQRQLTDLAPQKTKK